MEWLELASVAHSARGFAFNEKLGTKKNVPVEKLWLRLSLLAFGLAHITCTLKTCASLSIIQDW